MNIYKAAIDRWGWISQVDMAIEECAELIVALQHFVRNKATPEDVENEIADVEIMIEQLKIMFPGYKHKNVKQRKLDRLKAHLEDK